MTAKRSKAQHDARRSSRQLLFVAVQDGRGGVKVLTSFIVGRSGVTTERPFALPMLSPVEARMSKVAKISVTLCLSLVAAALVAISVWPSFS